MPTFSEIRVSQNLSQARVAELAGVSIATVNRAENGHAIQPDKFKAMCGVVGVSPNEVTGVIVYSAVQAAAKRKKKAKAL